MRRKSTTQTGAVLLEELRKVDTHPTANELHDMVRQRLPRTSLATTYRNLSDLANRRLIRVIENGPGPVRYDARMTNHYHLRCINCGRVVDATVEAVEGLEETLQGEQGWEILDHTLEFRGLCPACRLARQEGRLKLTDER